MPSVSLTPRGARQKPRVVSLLGQSVHGRPDLVEKYEGVLRPVAMWGYEGMWRDESNGRS